MLKKELRLIITFRDTVMAIRMEKAMKEAGLPRCCLRRCSQAAAVMLRMRRSQLRRRSRKLRQILCWRRNLKQNSKQDLKQNLKQTG